MWLHSLPTPTHLTHLTHFSSSCAHVDFGHSPLQLSEHISSIAEDTREETVYQIRVRTDASRKHMREMQAQIDRLELMVGNVCTNQGIEVPPPVDRSSISHTRGRARTGTRRANQRSKGLTKEASCSRCVRDSNAVMGPGNSGMNGPGDLSRLPSSPNLPPPASFEA